MSQGDSDKKSQVEASIKYAKSENFVGFYGPTEYYQEASIYRI